MMQGVPETSQRAVLVLVQDGLVISSHRPELRHEAIHVAQVICRALRSDVSVYEVNDSGVDQVFAGKDANPVPLGWLLIHRASLKTLQNDVSIDDHGMILQASRSSSSA
jgi:hypothetical protein